MTRAQATELGRLYRREYEAGASLAQIAAKHKSYPPTICRRIRLAGGTIRRRGHSGDCRRKLNKAQTLAIPMIYAETGHSMRFIANQFGISFQRVHQIVSKNVKSK